jgi:hypothetical protein
VELSGNQPNLLDRYLDHFRSLIGDERTERTFRGTVQGIVGAETLICSRIAAFSPCASHGQPERSATGSADG